ncbi:MFS transporter, partial [Acinetobacter baumannii]
VALYSLFISVASKEQPGTDFTILACAQLIIYFAGSMISGKIADSVGYGALFSLATLLSFVAVVATVRILNPTRLEVPRNR